MLSNSPVFPLMYFYSKMHNRSDNSNNKTIVGRIPNLPFGFRVIANKVLELGVWYMHHDTKHIYN
jgi:hypothetical protein